MINLIELLQYKRNHGSVTESTFINNWLIPIIEGLGHNWYMDGVGNIWVENSEEKHSLFVAHIDTVHSGEGFNLLCVENGIVKLSDGDKKEIGNCLGADDGVGIYCSLKMLEANVEGTYLFTRGEECGLIGASHIVDNLEDKLAGYQLCVEVDRMGVNEIITHQASGKCASDTFAEDLGIKLGMGHIPSDGGVFTDCSAFNHIIPECVNLAAGYYKQHTQDEYLNLNYVHELVDKLISVDWKSLPIERDVTDIGDLFNSWAVASNTYMSWDDLYKFVKSNPEKVTQYLFACGVDDYDINKAWEDSGYGSW